MTRFIRKATLCKTCGFVFVIAILYLKLGKRKVNRKISELNLNGVWTASGRNDTTEILVPAKVPGGIYSALEDHGVLKSKIYHDLNDFENRWVGRTNWTYLRQFIVPEYDGILSKARITLICDGLDTISSVFLNERNVGFSKNMFVRYEFDVTSELKYGINSLRVIFESPVLFAQKEFKNHVDKYGYEVLPKRQAHEFLGESKVQMIRKMQSSFAWDWVAAYPSSGIWKNIYIQAFNGAVVRDVLIFTTPSLSKPDETDKTIWKLKAIVYFEVASTCESGILRITSSNDSRLAATKNIAFSSVGNVNHSISISIPGSKMKLWWPNGYGNQALYNFTVTYQSDSHNEVSSKVVRVGFRTVQLVEDLIDPSRSELGREFYFKVNGMKFYSKGSNSIPLHILPERVTQEQTRWLLESARDVHMNMIRVWGGGIYESDLFYDIADELGIFIWQDFMFACSLYPATPEFLDNVKKEVTTQVKRLQHHPSIILWAGNNENEAALRQNWFGTDENFDVYRSDYRRLYIETMKPLVQSLDPSRKYLSSSPTNGIQSELEGWVAKKTEDARYGDIHQYNYDGDPWNWRTFKEGRFASEYGFQSFPYLETLKQFTNNIDEWTWNSGWVSNRQHHPRGQGEIKNFIETHLPLPSDYDSVVAFPIMLYLTQITQVMGQKTESEFYRRLMDKFNETTGVGHNMGALYWQLNDIGPYCSWASIEYNGRWKMLHYYAKMFFAPVLPSPYLTVDGDVAIELISDSTKQISRQMRVRVFKSDSMKPLIEEEKSVSATYLSSREVFRVTNSQLKNIGCSSRNKRNSVAAPCIVYVDFHSGCVSNFLYLQYPVNKKFITNPNITVTNVKKLWDGKITFELKVDQIAQFVFLNLVNRPDGRFISKECGSPAFDGNLNNGFLMVDATKFMIYQSTNPISVSEFIEQLEILTLYNAVISV